jgi:glycosyltransferase involved in cell wall biosynthesis
MKILISSRCSWTLYNFRRGLCRVLQEKGWHVLVGGAGGDGYDQKLQQQGLEFEDLPVDKKGLNPWRDIQLCWSLYQWYRREQPDVVHHFTVKPVIYGSLAARFAGVPKVISTITGLGYAFIGERRLLQRVVMWLYRLSLSACHTVFFQNTEDMAFFLEHRLVTEEQAKLIPGSGVDTAFFAPVPATRSTAVRFLFPSRLLKDKGVCEYVAAARWIKKSYPETIFWLLGDRDVRNPAVISATQLKEWQREAVVEYLGMAEDVREIMGQADVVVLPSYREGLSRVLLEAASMEKPLITTDVSGCREVVDDGVNGLLVPVRSISSLVDAMTKMLESGAAQRVRMGKQGRERIQGHFDEKIVIQQTLIAYEGKP